MKPEHILILYCLLTTLLAGTAGLPIAAALLLTAFYYYTKMKPQPKQTWKKLSQLCIILLIVLIPAIIYAALTEKPTCWILIDGKKTTADCSLIHTPQPTATYLLTSPNGSAYHIPQPPTSPTATRPYKPKNQTP